MEWFSKLCLLNNVFFLWIEMLTIEKIKNLLAEGVVDSLTRLVLVNAIYFKGSWEKQFKVQATRELPFKMNKVSAMYL